MHMMEKNYTWELVEKPHGRKIVGLKWIYKIKAQLGWRSAKIQGKTCSERFTQMLGIDYFETFSPVARIETVRTLIAFAAQKQEVMTGQWYKTKSINNKWYRKLRF